MTDNKPAALWGTDQQQLIFLNTHWGSTYAFALPRTAGGPWTATAKSGQHDQIEAPSAGQLLEEIHRRKNAGGTQPSNGPASSAR
jgi:hypothetical protein